ncbi:MAG: magnesium transporter CorA family protein [Kofleriaceae bacterium]
MFRVLDLLPDGRLEVTTADDRVAPPPAGTVRWVDLVEPDPDALACLRERFDFHPLAIDDCASFGLQSKVDDYERYLFVVVHAFTAAVDDPLMIQVHEIHAFVGAGYLVTVHDNPFDDHERVWSLAASDRRQLERGPAWMLYRQLDAMVAAAEPLVLALRERLDDLETEVIEQRGRPDLSQVFRIRRSMVAMRRVIRPLRDTVTSLHRRTDDRIPARVALHFRDVADHVGRLTELVEEIREVTIGVTAAYQAVEAARANEIIKRLTIFSAVFLPLSFIVGFFGQNFDHLPHDSDLWLGLMLASLVVVPAGLLEWFRRNWL